MAKLTFYFDFGSPWSYLAAMRLPAVQAATGAVVQWQPMLLGGVFRATGNRAPIEVPAKARYMLVDLHRSAKVHGVPLVMNPYFPVNTLQPMRLAMAAHQQQPDAFAPLCAGLFRALWQERCDLSNSDVLQATLKGLPVDGARLWAAAQSQEIKDALRAATDRAVERGVFGAPTFFVEHSEHPEREEMYFGHDRLESVQAELMR